MGDREGAKWDTMGDREGGGGKWDLRVVESSFSDCAQEAWINNTVRYQVCLAFSLFSRWW